MKEELIGKNCARLSGGFSTLEILIAFAIVTTALVAAASVSFGAQSLVLDGELNLGALSRVEEVFEEIRALQTQDQKNFYNIFTATSTIDNFYEESKKVLDITPCVKKMSVTEKWNQENRSRDVSFSQIFTYPLGIFETGESCYGPELFAPDWVDYSSDEFSIEIPGASEEYAKITDLDIVDGTAFVSANGEITTDPDIFLFDTQNYAQNFYTKISELDVGAGIFAIDATHEYVFAVTNSTSSQFVVIDVSDKSTPMLVASRSLAGVDPFGSYPQGRNIKYFDSKVYIGTKETAGPEFHVFNVANPESPFEIGFLEITHNINDIAVRDGVAYLATSADTTELIVLDVQSPAGMGMFEIGAFNAGTSAMNDRDAMSIYLLGDIIYLGRKRGAALNPEFYMLDISLPDEPSLLGLFPLALSGITSYVSGIVVSGDIAFVSTTDPTKGLFVLDVSDPLHIEKIEAAQFTHPLSAIDIKNGVIYGTDNLTNKIYEIQKN